MRRRVKIAGTLGPACDDERTMGRLVRAGLDIARLNFSHGVAAEQERRVKRLRKASRQAGWSVALMADLQGPRFRIGRVRGGELELVEGASVELVAGKTDAPVGKLPVSYAALAEDVRRGNTILIDDGKVELKVERVRGSVVRCEVARGGKVTDRKGINLPGVDVSMPTITSKDRSDLRVAVGLGADWLAISFVRSSGDVRDARRLLKRAGADLPVMAKIERPEAIDRLDEILNEADGVLVARGDLGVELPAEEVPMLQKQIIDAANALGKPAMTATQMLDSMRYARRPTRAEASDVANAVLDGSSSLLLTAETAAGKYPVDAVRTMDRIIIRAESSGRTRPVLVPPGELSVSLATTHAACRAAIDVGARYLVAFTCTGSTAYQVARFRPAVPILAVTPSSSVERSLHAQWGVQPLTIPMFKTIEKLMEALDRTMLDRSLARAGETVVVIGGSPVGLPGTTNVIKVHQIGSALGPVAAPKRRAARKQKR
jgi:pyruvate kinase